MKNYNIFISLLCAFATLVVSSAHHDRAVHVHAARDVNGGMNTQVVNSVTRGVKAGLSGYQGIQQKQAFSQLTPHISWYSDYQATTPDVGNVAGVPMVSLSTFKASTKSKGSWNLSRSLGFFYCFC